jgi:hypothetical protein
MVVQFKNISKINSAECHVHFSTKRFIVSGEYELTVKIQDGHAVKIENGTCINSDGWFDWDECIEENELLALVNHIYEGVL